MDTHQDCSVVDMENTMIETHTSVPDFSSPIVNRVVASPVLMPPPTAIPKIPPKVAKAFPKLQSSKLGYTESSPVTVGVKSFRDNNYSTNKRDHCSVPTKDIKCNLTHNTKPDNATKLFLHSQVRKKIYTKPNKTNYRVKPKKVPEIVASTEPMQSSVNQFKVNQAHFKNKAVTIDDIDFDSLDVPMRSSTPTPCDVSTILAGHLDFSLDNTTLNEVEEQEEVSSQSNSDEFLKSFINVKTVPKQKKTVAEVAQVTEDTEEKSISKNYCQKWVQNETGVSTKNEDAPPSLYEPSIALGDSLLDITSVSRNIPTPEPKKPKYMNNVSEKGRGIINFDVY